MPLIQQTIKAQISVFSQIVEGKVLWNIQFGHVALFYNGRILVQNKLNVHLINACIIVTYELTSSSFLRSLSFSLQTSSWSRSIMSLTLNRSLFSRLSSCQMCPWRWIVSGMLHCNIVFPQPFPRILTASVTSKHASVSSGVGRYVTIVQGKKQVSFFFFPFL